MSHLNNDKYKIMDLSEDSINFSHQDNYFNFLDYRNLKIDFNNKEEDTKSVNNLSNKYSITINENEYFNNNNLLINTFPKFYSFDDILKKIKNAINIDWMNLLVTNDIQIEEAENEMKLIRQKKITLDYDYYTTTENEKNIQIELHYKRGRKPNNDNSERIHTKYKSDNIMKKIKGIFFKYLVYFINNILYKYNIERDEKDKIIKELDYDKYINHLRKIENVTYLYQSIQKLLSNDISPKYKAKKGFDINSNRNNIKMILEKEQENEVINYVFNIKFGEWIDLLIMEKDIKEIGKISDIGYTEIKKNLPTINDLIKDVKQNNDKTYLSLFLFYLFNYKRSLFIKNARKRKNKKH